MKMETGLRPPSKGVQIWAANKLKSVERAPRLFDAKPKSISHRVQNR
jgi:hypothetical protein